MVWFQVSEIDNGKSGDIDALSLKRNIREDDDVSGHSVLHQSCE